MFGMGFPEIMLIVAVALVVVGPKKLPGLAKTLGRAMGEFKTATRDFKRSIDIDGDLQDVRDSFKDLKDVPTYDADTGAYEKKTPAPEQPDQTDGSDDEPGKNSGPAEDENTSPKTSTGADPNGADPNG